MAGSEPEKKQSASRAVPYDAVLLFKAITISSKYVIGYFNVAF